MYQKFASNFGPRLKISFCPRGKFSDVGVWVGLLGFARTLNPPPPPCARSYEPTPSQREETTLYMHHTHGCAWPTHSTCTVHTEVCPRPPDHTVTDECAAPLPGSSWMRQSGGPQGPLRAGRTSPKPEARSPARSLSNRLTRLPYLQGLHLKMPVQGGGGGCIRWRLDRG